MLQGEVAAQGSERSRAEGDVPLDIHSSKSTGLKCKAVFQKCYQTTLSAWYV